MHLLSDVATRGRNIAFGNKVAKNVASDIERLLSPRGARSEGMVPPLSPQIKICGDPIKKAHRKSEGLLDISSNGRRITPYPNWLKAYASKTYSAIERSRERQRRARLPPQGIA